MPSKKPRKPLPEIVPCPRGCRPGLVEGANGHWYVMCECGWEGPTGKTKLSAIWIWNTAWNPRPDAEAEQRGAEKAMRWLAKNFGEMAIFVRDLEAAIERGEVVGKQEPWIACKPGVLGGKPHVRGTKLTVAALKKASRFYPAVEILKDNPGLTHEGLAAALAYIWKEDGGEVAGKQNGAKRP